MPLYRYQCDNCKAYKEAFHPSSCIPEKEQCEKCGHPATRRFGARTQGTAGWPMTSESMAVQPWQVADAAAQARALGVPTNYDKHGRPILESPRHRKRYAEAHGFYDRNAGYSDPTRK